MLNPKAPNAESQGSHLLLSGKRNASKAEVSSMPICSEVQRRWTGGKKSKKSGHSPNSCLLLSCPCHPVTKVVS
eukprot:scaffold318892_cov13-Tisochrysis_lutea.AAC.1